MTKKKHHKKESQPKIKDQVGDKIYRPKPKPKKPKYNHAKHWLKDVVYDDEEIDLYGRSEEE